MAVDLRIGFIGSHLMLRPRWPRVAFSFCACEKEISKRALGKARAEKESPHYADAGEQVQGESRGEESWTEVSESRGQYECGEKAADGGPQKEKLMSASTKNPKGGLTAGRRRLVRSHSAGERR
jgi:hypothetical protein